MVLTLMHPPSGNGRFTFADYDDYFEQVAAIQLQTTQPLRLLFETSRGCWWGAKHHCTFLRFERQHDGLS